MKSKELLKIKNKLKKLIKDKEIHDIVLFGSSVKGKNMPSDIDLAIISEKKIGDIKGFHISNLNVKDFLKPVSLVKTLLREGYSLKKGVAFSEVYGFKNKCLFKYDLRKSAPSKKVKIVNFLRGKRDERGLVLEKGGEWISNQVFFCPVMSESIFERFFLKNKIKFKKYFILID